MMRSSVVVRGSMLLAVVVLANVSSVTASQASTTSDSTAVNLELSIDSVIREFAERYEISLADAHLAFDETTRIADFQAEHASDPSFGAVWTTYLGKYEVHVRTVRGQGGQDLVAALEDRLGRNVIATSGGLSYQGMRDLVETFSAASSSDGTLAFDVDETTGEIRYKGDLPDGANGTGALQVDAVDSSLPVEGWVGHGAADIQQQQSNGSWSPVCTVGAFYETSTTTGFITAAHCPDSNLFADGTYSSALAAENCSNDSQSVRISANPNLDDTYYDKRTYPHPSITVAGGVAGGWFVGQPTLKLGLYSNGTTGSNTGSMQGSGTYVQAATGDCATRTITVVRSDNPGAPGDSGGPILLWYNNKWFVGSTTSGPWLNSSGTVLLGTSSVWNSRFALPTGAHLCNSLTPCS